MLRWPVPPLPSGRYRCGRRAERHPAELARKVASATTRLSFSIALLEESVGDKNNSVVAGSTPASTSFECPMTQ